MLALRRNNPDPTGRRFVEVPLAVDSQAVGNAGSRIFADVDEHHAVDERAVRLDLVTLDELVAAAVRIEIFFIRRKGDSVGVRYIRDHPAHLAVPEHVNPAEIQLLLRILFPETEAAESVREINRPVLFHDDVVGAAEALSLVAIGENGALAVV